MLAKAVVENVEEIFNQNKYADKVIEKCLKSQKNRGAQDRAFIAENTYEIVRWWRQLVFLSNYKESDKINYWDILATHLYLNSGFVATWDTTTKFNPEKIKSSFKFVESNFELRESYPHWLYTQLNSELSTEKVDSILVAMNEPSKVSIRVNTLKNSNDELAKTLKTIGISISKSSYSTNGFVLTERSNVFSTEPFKNGLFEIQDIGSQVISEYLDVKPGMRVIDACAGAGGKTIHLAALMQNKGSLIAMDLEEWKLNELKKRARRAGSSIIQTKIIESSKTIKRLENSCDRLLLDVPCSGIGVIRRNPDAKWKLNKEFIARVQQEQENILDQYPKMLKSNGILVYATCSVLPSENEKQVEKFLQKHSGAFELLQMQTLYPDNLETDGFFMAKIVKK